MGILSTSKKVKDTKLVGANLPLQVHNYLSIYCIAEDTTKSRVIRKLLGEFFVDTDSFEVYLEKVVQKIRKRFRKLKKEGGISLKLFIQNLRIELERKGMTEDLIEIIISKSFKE